MMQDVSYLTKKIRKAPDFVPSFRSEVPLGLTDDMLSLAMLGPASMPILQLFLVDSNSKLRRAAVVMLAYVDTAEAEELVAAAVEDEQVRAQAILCLGNMFLRDPNSRYASENRFLRNPSRALKVVLKYIDDNTIVTINSGFKVYEGPLADLALGVGVRIAGLKLFEEQMDLDDHRLIGLMPYSLSPALKERLRAIFHKL